MSDARTKKEVHVRVSQNARQKSPKSKLPSPSLEPSSHLQRDFFFLLGGIKGEIWY